MEGIVEMRHAMLSDTSTFRVASSTRSHDNLRRPALRIFDKLNVAAHLLRVFIRILPGPDLEISDVVLHLPQNFCSSHLVVFFFVLDPK